MPLATPSSSTSLEGQHSRGAECFTGRLGPTGWLRGVWNRAGRVRRATGWHARVPVTLLSDILIQERSQLEGLVLKQGVGLGHQEGEPSYQLPLHQCQAGELGVVDEALPAEDGVINAATWKDTGSGGCPQNAFLFQKQHSDPRNCSPLPFSTAQPSPIRFPLVPHPTLSGTDPPPLL